MKTEIINDEVKKITAEDGCVLTNGGEFDMYPIELTCNINDNSWYEIKDSNITDVEFTYVDYRPEKRYEVTGTKTKYLELLSDYPELGLYRKQTNLQVYYNGDMIYFYADDFQPGHREILQNYLTIKDRQNII